MGTWSKHLTDMNPSTIYLYKHNSGSNILDLPRNLICNVKTNSKQNFPTL